MPDVVFHRVRFDPQATMYINTQVVRDFVKVLPAPLGFGRELTDFVPEDEMNAFMGKTLDLETRATLFHERGTLLLCDVAGAALQCC